jgi:hypothetical protein
MKKSYLCKKIIMWFDWQNKVKQQAIAIPKHLLWDMDLENFDLQKNKKIVVQRVIEDGLPEDYDTVFSLYGGVAGVREIIKQIHHFRYPQDIAFVCVAFNLKKEELECYKRQQLRNQYMNF